MPSSTTTTNPSRPSSNTTSTTATAILSGEQMTNGSQKDSTARTPTALASDTTPLSRQTPSTTDSSMDAKQWPYDILEGFRYKCLLCGNIRSMGRRVNHATAQRHVLASKFQNHSVWLQNNAWVRATKEANATSETGNDEDENSADHHDQENNAVDELNGEDDQDRTLQPTKA
jgi:hypothetical protein